MRSITQCTKIPSVHFALYWSLLVACKVCPAGTIENQTWDITYYHFKFGMFALYKQSLVNYVFGMKNRIRTNLSVIIANEWKSDPPRETSKKLLHGKYLYTNVQVVLMQSHYLS